MQRSYLSYALLGAFLLAVAFLEPFIEPSYPIEVWAALVLGSGSLVAGLFLTGRRGMGGLLLCAVMGTSLALLTVSHWAAELESPVMEKLAAEKSVTITGVIADAPAVLLDRIVYIVETDDGDNIEVTMKGGGEALPYGSTVEVTGSVRLPEKDDHYAHYLQSRGIVATMSFGRIKVTGENRGNPFFRVLFWTRKSLEDRLTLLFPEPEASLITGLLTGSRGSMPPGLSDAFRDTGLTHIVAISGSNITIILMLLQHALFFVPLKWRLVPSWVAITLFVLFVGASASAVRAGVMGSIGLVAVHFGRQRDARLAILWSAFLMLLWNPSYLWYDAGFQLSFLAILGITEVLPVLQKQTEKLPELGGVTESLVTTIAAQIATTPWIAFAFGRLSTIAPLSNVILTPLIPASMALGTISLIVGLFSVTLGRIIALLAWLPLALVTRGAMLLARIPFASIETVSMTVPVIVLLYALIIVLKLIFEGVIKLPSIRRGATLSAAPSSGKTLPVSA